MSNETNAGHRARAARFCERRRIRGVSATGELSQVTDDLAAEFASFEAALKADWARGEKQRSRV